MEKSRRVGAVDTRQLLVMPALVAGIHVFLLRDYKTWMAGTSPAIHGNAGANIWYRQMR
jgi:hypothetical protein